MQNLSSIHQLKIVSCPLLLSLIAEEEQDRQQQGFPCSLQYLKVSRCEALVKLPQALLSLSSLRDIEIFDCNSLVSFPEAAFTSQLKTIRIMECNSFESLPEAWLQDTGISLESLYIGYCNSLTYIARIQLPQSLKRLEIKDCNNLRTLIAKEGNPSGRKRYASLLEYLIIGFCPNLEYLDDLPTTLQHLDLGYCSKKGWRITDCKNLKFLPDGLCNLRHLQEIYICDCPSLVSFCKGGLLSTKLTKLWINGCNKLEALPNCMHRLTSLQNLAIGICPSTVSFPENGFPTNPTSLAIYDKICKPLFEWGLSRFTSLKHLSIGRCPDVVSFPQEEMGMTIPASLTHLDIVNFPSLERLSSIGENLTALKSLVSPIVRSSNSFLRMVCLPHFRNYISKAVR
ncbi:NB-ARC domain-containing disease resistance protein [Melia azedarach]|uniref:NB-ARC domain-containing disease resistance protein n=1 Tax=Melia azedarach TaxID=155640 RepID=A0ACC1YHH7_MELAZ|nr:NB-ARC domain-containing disease resistance protein [Melia azedarach]